MTNNIAKLIEESGKKNKSYQRGTRYILSNII